MRQYLLTASLSLFLAQATTGKAPPPPFYIGVYGDSPGDTSQVQSTTLAITNTDSEHAAAVTSLELDGQLPETRYFYHGIYGSSTKKGDQYVVDELAQQLTQPFASCLLLPGQTARWTRPFRLVGSQNASISWKSIPIANVPRIVYVGWVNTNPNKTGFDCPLLRTESFPAFRNRGDFAGQPPLCIVEGWDAISPASGTVAVNLQPAARLESDQPEASLEGVAAQLVYRKSDGVLQDYDAKERSYQDFMAIPIPAADLILSAYRGVNLYAGERQVPCILHPEIFGDILKVELPHTRMYYSAGITAVGLKNLRAILLRAKEKGIVPEVVRIDPNSIGQMLVLVFGVKIDAGGRWLDPPAPK